MATDRLRRFSLNYSRNSIFNFPSANRAAPYEEKSQRIDRLPQSVFKLDLPPKPKKLVKKERRRSEVGYRGPEQPPLKVQVPVRESPFAQEYRLVCGWFHEYMNNPFLDLTTLPPTPLLDARADYRAQRLDSVTEIDAEDSHQRPDLRPTPHVNQAALAAFEGREHVSQAALAAFEDRPHVNQAALAAFEGRPHANEAALAAFEGRPHANEDALAAFEGRPHVNEDALAAFEGRAKGAPTRAPSTRCVSWTVEEIADFRRFASLGEDELIKQMSSAADAEKLDRRVSVVKKGDLYGDWYINLRECGGSWVE